MYKKIHLNPKSLVQVGMVMAIGLGGISYANDLMNWFGQTKGNVNQANSTLLTKKDTKTQFLPVHKAFDVNASQQGDKLVVNFQITPKHYIYQDKLKLDLPKGVLIDAWQFSQDSVMVDDPDFGRVPVFDKSVTATTTIQLLQPSNDITSDIGLTWQGCAMAGLCYPPQKLTIAFDTKWLNKAQDNWQNSNSNNANNTNHNNSDSGADTQIKSATQHTPLSTDDRLLTNNLSSADSQSLIDNQLSTKYQTDKQTTDNQTTDNQTTDKQKPNNSNTRPNYPLNHVAISTINDPFGFGQNPLLAIGLLFVAGVVLSFSACIYPMIPIVANIVAKSHNPTPVRGFLLTLSYALGVATSYGVLGAVVAWFGGSLGLVGYLQNPVLLIGFALLFVLLSCHMMGVFYINMPSVINNKLSKISQLADHKLGSLGGSYMVGALSSLVVSPCVSAPLGGSLLAISVIGNVPLGFVALFALGMGLSLPLLLLGLTQGHFMPKSGQWTHYIKHFGAMMLLAVAILLISRVFFGSWLLLVWAVWFMAVACFLWSLKRLLLRAVGLMAVIWSALLMTGFALGHDDALRPLVKYNKTVSTAISVSTLPALDEILATHDKVLVDVTAQWCIECRIMERTLFANPPSSLQDWQVVKLDITETNEDSRQVLARYDLFGPPSLLFYHKGQLVNKQIGEVGRTDFEAILASLP